MQTSPPRTFVFPKARLLIPLLAGQLPGSRAKRRESWVVTALRLYAHDESLTPSQGAVRCPSTHPAVPPKEISFPLCYPNVLWDNFRMDFILIRRQVGEQGVQRTSTPWIYQCVRDSLSSPSHAQHLSALINQAIAHPVSFLVLSSCSVSLDLSKRNSSSQNLKYGMCRSLRMLCSHCSLKMDLPKSAHRCGSPWPSY